MLKAFPSILGEDRSQVVAYQQDLTHYYFLDPTHIQETNIFFMENTIRLKDNVWDFLELGERDEKLFEHSYSQNVPKWSPTETSVQDREYVNLFFRQDYSQRLYKREEYDMLTYFGDLGGLLDFVIIFGWAISHHFVSRLFSAALISQAYRVQKYLKDKTPFYPTSRDDGHLTTESDSNGDDKDGYDQDLKSSIDKSQSLSPGLREKLSKSVP